MEKSQNVVRKFASTWHVLAKKLCSETKIP